ncbi:hypothetical protein HED55_21675 [Ochrobactrum haematophilum]|uniref:Autotransporter outer membrane beta-barrel domain-containing protein n=1 Tax=Brucella haematophila TaxID=419474 RepID=A0ABX1DTF6_9HYPH|nr:hypothetical protein [Brucella haematophila]
MKVAVVAFRSRRVNFFTSSALALILTIFCGQEAEATCAPGIPTAGATVACSNPANPLAPSYTAAANNITVNVDSTASFGVLLGVGGTAFSLTGDNVSLNNSGTINPSLLGLLSVLSSGTVVGNASASDVNVTNHGTLGGTVGLLGFNLAGLTGMALAVQNGAGGTTNITNTGVISTTALAGVTVASGDSPAVAVYGGGQIAFANSGTINGRVAFEASGISGLGNSFHNSGNIIGGVSLGADSKNLFTAYTGSSVTAGIGAIGNSLGVIGYNLSFAPAGIVDGGFGGANTLQLDKEIIGPSTGSLNLSII